MTLEQAEKVFKQYNGSSFHMSREEPSVYEAFRAMDLSDGQKDQWRMEIAEEHLKKIGAEEERSWSFFSSMAEVLMAVRTLNGLQEEYLIEGIRRQEGCEETVRTITLETVCGRTWDHHDGVIAWFRKHDGDLSSLKDVTDRLLPKDGEPINPHFAKAIALYRSLIGE